MFVADCANMPAEQRQPLTMLFSRLVILEYEVKWREPIYRF